MSTLIVLERILETAAIFFAISMISSSQLRSPHAFPDVHLDYVFYTATETMPMGDNESNDCFGLDIKMCHKILGCFI